MATGDLPSALVIQWSSGHLRVKCPYCLMSHGHGPGHQSWTTQRRRADCDDGGNYLLIYPPTSFEGEMIGWEFDTEEQCLFAVTPQGRVKDPLEEILPHRRLLPEFDFGNSSLDGITEVLGGTTISDSAGDSHTEKQSPTSDFDEWLREPEATPKGRNKLFVSRCCEGKIGPVLLMLREYPDHNFKEVLDFEGGTAAHQAIYNNENRIPLLELLDKYGFNLDQTDHYGRTPLMEASLWARKDAVRYLVEHGANVLRRDANDMSAFDLSQASRRNEHERTTRARKVYHPPASDEETRRFINKYLQRYMPEPNPSQESGPHYDDRVRLFRRNSAGVLAFYKPAFLYELPNPDSQKAIGILSRGPAYPDVSAMSGYTQPGWRNVLDNATWTDNAVKLCKLVGHPKGKSYASHVEKQLIAFYKERHLSLEGQHGHDEENGRRTPWAPIAPKLEISVNKSEPCPDCRSFTKRFEAKYGVQVIYHTVGERG